VLLFALHDLLEHLPGRFVLGPDLSDQDLIFFDSSLT
jgi:hypothetical protein